MKKVLPILFMMFFLGVNLTAQKVQINSRDFIEINAVALDVSSQDKLLIDKQLADYDVYDFDLESLRALVKERPTQANLIFNLPGKSAMKVTIHEHDIRSSDYRATAMTENGLVEIPRGDCITYKGYTEPGEEVRLTITEEMIYGFIEVDNEDMFIMSLPTVVKGTEGGGVITYFPKDIKGEMNVCLVDDTGAGNSPPPPSTSMFLPTCKIMEFATDADREQFNAAGSIAAANAIALADLNVAEAIYVGAFNLAFEVVFQNVWTVAANLDPYVSTAAGTIPFEVSTAATMAPFNGVQRDYLMLYSGKNATAPGASFVGVICTNPGNSVGYVTPAGARFSPRTTAHEVGHALGARHPDGDDCGGPGQTIMCGGTINGNANFSVASRAVIQGFIDPGPCLDTPFTPTSDDFEGTLGNWTQSNTDNFNWTIRSGSTPSSNTGPSSAFRNTRYIYTEASGRSNQVAQIISPEYFICGSGIFLSFGYHMFGSNMGNLRVEITDDMGATWQQVWTRTGNQGNAWLNAAISLNNFQSSIIQIRITGTVGNGFRSDMAIDDLAIGGSCSISANPNVLIIPQGGGTVTSSISGSGSWEAHLSNNTWATINANIWNSTVSVTAPANTTTNARTSSLNIFCGPTVYSIFVVQPGITVPPPTPCGAPFTSLPNNLTFESTWLAGWTQDASDDINWTRRSGSTPSWNTGPSGAATGSFYMYTEASSGNSNKVANLVSPCYNLAGVPSPAVSFSYHMLGSNMGTLRLQVSQNGGSTWSTIWTRNGSQGSNWLNSGDIDLSSYTSVPIQLRLNGTTGNGWSSDIAIDNVVVESQGCYDNYEPNNSLSQTYSTTMGNSITFNNICLSPGDNDYFLLINGSNLFKVRVRGRLASTTGDYSLVINVSGNTVTAQTQSWNGSNTDTYLYIYSVNNALLASNDNWNGVFSRATAAIPGAFAPDVAPKIKANPKFDLGNYPNPFSDLTTFSFNLEEASPVSLTITNLNGKRVATPINQVDYDKGSHQVEFDASALPMGVYLYTLATKNGVKSKQMIIVR